MARLAEKLADEEVLREQMKHAMADLASQNATTVVLTPWPLTGVSVRSLIYR